MLGDGTQIEVPFGLLIQPIRKIYLPKGHRFTRDVYDETTDMVADTTFGIILISLKDVEF